jgi:predicted unusual protein kinase regulating ubiquinone biosynthesis (AarF/ABC1/UbiB family)
VCCQINLIDFGASRSFSKTFVDKYIRIIHAAANNDRTGVIEWSRATGFLTGYETKVKERDGKNGYKEHDDDDDARSGSWSSVNDNG